MTLLTPWGEALDPDAPLPQYPRPQLVRGRWQNLNGRWSCAFTPFRENDPLAVADPTHPPARFDVEIVVPFSPEVALSGVDRALRVDETLWYRRPFTVAEPSERVILHFGAVDQSCRVAVDGVEVGGHTGGYLPFALDITDALADGDEHELVVAVRDVTDTSWLARGKQKTARGGIWYTPQSGIWQTVWLETVPRIAVDRLVLTPELAAGALDVMVESLYAESGMRAAIEVLADGEVIAAGDAAVGEATRIRLPDPVHPWSPEDPFLYDVRVRLGDDVVSSYVGMRSFGLGEDVNGMPRLLLNGEPYLHVGLLDQGYWPDGGYTAPSDAALEYDIRLAKRAGYTMLRKHIKVEPLRWYHHCDRLGMLVWQDAVNGGRAYNPLVVTAPAFASPSLDDTKHARFGRRDVAGRARFEAELAEMIEHLRSVPSIAVWVPFNEGWGQFDAARIAGLVRDLDPTRTIDHASGWHDQRAGDVRSLHIYFRPVRAPRGRDPRALAITEYGGYSLGVPGHTFSGKVDGYRTYRSRDRLAEGFERLHDRELVPAVSAGVAATVYTQLSDVEDEVNGLVTYDRRFVKIPVERVRAVNDRMRAAAAASAAPRHPHPPAFIRHVLRLGTRFVTDEQIATDEPRPDPEGTA
ncbi:glycoside hydrolase family 2 protein [Microbacterium sp. ASV49]|uniref:Glycoside hydrolase family 2 TIM barrel-domain containing protein n=1 Tax=Microbacterium candidum TaxID=3041922 RepID=A0ABT7MWP4_9MICO|nr:sugar-binding domain-containing protein [Microbacterium sp. ASV49]MDL9978879.1 glycoside hydrolase family 2 TIM barrel-domain containing protein [Microbacterium sp. ASV49]